MSNSNLRHTVKLRELYSKNNIPLIRSIDDSRFRQTWKRRCTNMNHEDEDNHRMDTFLVLEFNDVVNKFLDINPEYWCQDCAVEDCDI